MNHITLNKERSIHSIKTALAVLIGFVLTKTIHLPVDQWLIITIIVVMCAQVNVGSMIQKSTMRFLGTLSGSIVAMLTLTLAGTNALVSGIAITLSAIFFSYLATGKTRFSESGTLGAVTVTIILVSQTPTLTTAIGRFLEITAGILIAALVSQFILPTHARNLLRRKQTQTLRQLRSYYLATFLINQNNNDEKSYQEIDDNIIKSLIAQRKLASEALQEPFAKKTTIVIQANNLLWCEREIQRTISFMHYAYKSSPQAKNIFSNMTILNDFHDKIYSALDTMANHLEKNSYAQLSVIIPTIDPIKNVILTEKNNLSIDDATYTYTFLFCAEILIARLTYLSKLIDPRI